VGTPVSSGQALIWNGTTYVFGNPSGVGSAGGSSSLTGLNDTLVIGTRTDQGLVYQPSISKYVNTSIIYAPTGLTADGTTLNTTILQTALNRGGMVYLPTGTYFTGPLFVTKNYTHFFGEGVLLAQTGYAADALLMVSGHNCLVEGITINGNSGTYDRAIGRGEGIVSVGNNNTIRSVKVISMPSGGSANAIAIRNGINNLVENCFVSGAGFAGYYANADYATFRNNFATHFRNKGFTFNGGPYNQLTVDGFYADNPVSMFLPNGGGTSFQIDPGPNPTDYIRNASIKNVYAGNGLTGGNCTKFANIRNLVLENCTFYPKETGSAMENTIAEGIENLTITNSWLVGTLNFDSTVGNLILDTVRFGEYPNNLIQNNGSGYNPVAMIFDLQSTGSVMIRNCNFFGFSARAIDIDNPPVEEIPTNGYKSIWIEGCHFAGSGAGSIREIGFTSNGNISRSRRFGYFRNTNAVYGGGTITPTVSTWTPVITPLNYALTQYAGTAAPTSSSTVWQAGDEIVNTGAVTVGAIGRYQCIASGSPGIWVPMTITSGTFTVSSLLDTNTNGSGIGSVLEVQNNGIWAPTFALQSLKKALLTGVYYATDYGVTNTGANVTQAIKTFLNLVPDGAKVNFPAGIYNITGTIFIDRKHNLRIDASQAQFREPYGQVASGGSALGSGTFYFHYCTGITFMGGTMSGYGTHGAIMALSSGLMFSGYNTAAFDFLAGDTQGSRNVIPVLFNLEQCTDMYITDWKVRNKYRFAFAHRCMNLNFYDNHFLGVLTGDLQRQSNEIVLGPTGNGVELGQIHKVCARQNYCLTIVKGQGINVRNFNTASCGGLMTCGSTSLGGGQGPAKPELINISDCYLQDSYDNHIYLSSCMKAKVQNVRGINNPAFSYAIDGIKGRGSYITFEDCYVEHSYHGYGIEGMGNTSDIDYWTNGASPGWSSHGCAIRNCIAVDCNGRGIVLDANDDDTVFPRDVVIEGNYFYECCTGPFGRNPTGAFSGDNYSNAVISAPDALRCVIRNNTIENTGVLSANQAIFAGTYRLPAGTWISGVEISNNKFLGCKQGMRLVNLSNARVYNNYGERIGTYGAPYIDYSGSPALIVTENFRDSRIYDNQLGPTGHAAMLYVLPDTTFSNVIRRDNDSYEVIN